MAHYTPRLQRIVGERGTALRFDLDMRRLGVLPLQLAAPVTVTLHVGDLMDLSPRPDRWPYLAYQDEESGEWVRVPVRSDPEAGTLTARVDHFSPWESGLEGLMASG